MKNLIENLWYGNIDPSSDYYQKTDEKVELIKKRVDLYDKLILNLNEEQRKILEEYDECNVEIYASNEKEIFEYSFRLGFNFATEMLK